MRGNTMNLRYKIADWISGGGIKRLRNERITALEGWMSSDHRCLMLSASLNKIAGLETPNASHTVKKGGAHSAGGAGR